jgi:4-diphosphocytidyl-2-C-methyl-D-erythritol kinase
VALLAPAKINPWLAVRAKRPDGYHEVDTCLCALSLCDRLVLERSDTGRLELELAGPAATPDVPADESNLAARALARALALLRAKRVVGERDGARLRLEKHVPSRAGLGGGSSDAAAAFVGLELLYGADVGEATRTHELAELGSDCAFFAVARESGLARCTGRGERA